MGKLVVLLCFALLAMTLVMACNLPGVPCDNDSDCCSSFICNPFSKRCTGWKSGAKPVGGPWPGPGGPWGPVNQG